jgi:hypothetical protein
MAILQEKPQKKHTFLEIVLPNKQLIFNAL